MSEFDVNGIEKVIEAVYSPSSSAADVSFISFLRSMCRDIKFCFQESKSTRYFIKIQRSPRLVV